MPSLTDIERLLERVFERSIARLFHAPIQLVQLDRRVERAMDRARGSDHGRAVAPCRYRVRMHPTDLAGAADRAGSAEALAGRLADAALAYGRAHGYHLDGRPIVALVADPSLERGQVEVDAVPGAGERSSAGRPAAGIASAPADGPAPAAAGPAGPVVVAGAAAHVPGPTAAPEPALATSAGSSVSGRAAGTIGSAAASPATRSAAILAALEAPGGLAAPIVDTPSGIRGDGTQTLVFRKPAPIAARAMLRALTPDGSEQAVAVDGTPLAIGRAKDNGLVLVDGRVSRHHGRLQARRGALVYTDLGSTNGSRVNGVRVDEIVLGVGDRLQIGDTVLVVETLPG
jgi:hypothetical protein